MALLKVKVKARVLIVWGTTRLEYVRNVNEIKDTSITFASATGQSYASGQVLFTVGSAGNAGFLQIRSKNSAVLSGTGLFQLTVEHYPTVTASAYTQNFTIDGQPTSIILNYNSKPQINSVIVETDYNVPYLFAATDFTDQFSDYDGDNLYDLRINGDVTGYTYDDIPYIVGTWIPLSHVDAGRLKYTPLGQSTAYDKDNTWDGRDSQGNISTNI
jgi:hypothetical protein